MKKISGKTRTRQHVIADLAVNHLERQVLLLGYTAQRIKHDYGYDLTITTYDGRGQIEGGVSFVQIKATDNLPLLKNGKTISWPVSRRDLKLWLNEQYPVILILYDGRKDKAYWLDVQAHVAAGSTAELFTGGETIHFYIPLAHRVTRTSLERLAERKRRVHRELGERRRSYG